MWYKIKNGRFSRCLRLLDHIKESRKLGMVDFKNAVSATINELIQHELGICPDQYVGKLKNIVKQKEILDSDRICVANYNNIRGHDDHCLIMVLESPHKDEFKRTPDKPGPAKGSTGRNIAYYIQLAGDKLNQCYENNYGLILMNAIQYQCSLGLPTKFFRDSVFLETWQNFEGENDFKERLKTTYRNGDVIANCCTKGNLKNIELRKLVDNAIGNQFGEIIRCPHPYSWMKYRSTTL